MFVPKLGVRYGIPFIPDKPIAGNGRLAKSMTGACDTSAFENNFLHC